MDSVPRHTTLQILREIQKWMGHLKCTPENFSGRVIFMSMFNDIILRDTQNELICLENSGRVSEYVKSFTLGRCSFLGLGSEIVECHRHCFA